MSVKKGTKFVMRTADEKLEILYEYFIDHISLKEISNKYNINIGLLKTWKKKYTDNGIEGLKSKTGIVSLGRQKDNPTKEEELERKVMKLEIENARLKKGYIVKGGGDQKEYVTTLEKSMK